MLTSLIAFGRGLGLKVAGHFPAIILAVFPFGVSSALGRSGASKMAGSVEITDIHRSAGSVLH